MSSVALDAVLHVLQMLVLVLDAGIALRHSTDLFGDEEDAGWPAEVALVMSPPETPGTRSTTSAHRETQSSHIPFASFQHIITFTNAKKVICVLSNTSSHSVFLVHLSSQCLI